MTDRVNPSFERSAESFLTASAIAGAGGSGGYIVPNSQSPTKPATVDQIDETQFNEFVASTSSTSLSVTINAGEAYIFGAWVARDDPTVLTLSANQNNQTVYLGWDHTEDDTVIIGLDGAFSNTDPQIPLYSFDTDGSGVTDTVDERSIGKDVVDEDKLSTAVSDHSNETTDVHGVTTGSVASTFDVNLAVQDHSSDTTGVHGVSGDVAGTDYVDTSVSDHSNETTGVHGVGSSTVASTDYVDTSVSDHSNKDMDVHGVSGFVVGTDLLDTFVADHANEDSGIHGVGTNTEIASLQQVISEISDHRVNDVHTQAQPPQTHDNTAHSTDYLAQSNRYADSEAVDAIDAVITAAASNLVGLDQQVSTNTGDITNLQTNQISTSDVNSRNWGDYEIQKNGTDGNNIINFKTQ